MIRRGGILLADLTASVSGVSRSAFVEASSDPVLVEVPAGTFGPHLRALAFDAAPQVRRAAWEERLEVLRCRLAPGEVRVFSLSAAEAGGSLTVGASPDADVPLPGDDGVAPRHAQLVVLKGLWRVIDLASPGSWIEGKRVPVGIPLPVVGGQRLRFGRSELMLLTPSQAYELAMPAVRARALDLIALTLPATGAALAPFLASVAETERAAFVGAFAAFLLQVPHEVCGALDEGPAGRTGTFAPDVILGLTRDRRARSAVVHALTPGRADGTIVIGRTRSCDVVLQESSVSKRHAVLRVRAGHLTLRDLESQNGTWVDATRLPAGVVTALRRGQGVAFGTYRALVLDPGALHDLAYKLTKCRGG